MTAPRSRSVVVGMVALMLLVLAWPAALGGATSYVVVSGVSMEPMLESGDLAVVRRAATYEVGDVIAFATEDGDVIHRIVGGSAADGFVTQGDNVDRVDPYRPRPSEIRGREVLHLPAVGGLGLRLVRVVPAPLLAAVAILLALGGSEQRRRRRRPRHATSVQSSPDPRPNGEVPMSQSPFQRPRIQLAAACALAALVVVPSAFVAWRMPATAEVPATEAPVRHTIDISLVGLADEPSDLYPDGRSETIVAGPDGTLPADSPTLLRGLLDRVEVTVTHDALGVDDAGGAGRVDVTVVTGTNFELPLSGVPTTTFDDDFRATTTIDLAEADRRFGDYLEASGLDRDTMTIRITPVVVTADGTTLLGGPVDLRPEGDVVEVDGTFRTVVTPDGETTVVTRTAALVGLPLPVPVVRWLGAAIVVGLLAVAAVALRRELDERPHVRIGLLHGSLLVDVAPETTVGGEVVRVVSMSELARLARRDQRPILHQERGDGSHHYLVPDGELTYEYVIDGPGAVAEADEAGPTTPDAESAVVDLDDLAAASTQDGPAADEPMGSPDDLPVGKAVHVEDFAALTRIWMRDNPAPGRMQRRRLPDGRTRFSVVRNGREYVYETQPTERAASTGRR